MASCMAPVVTRCLSVLGCIWLALLQAGAAGLREQIFLRVLYHLVAVSVHKREVVARILINDSRGNSSIVNA